MSQLQSPEVFKIGEQLTAQRLNNIVNNTVILPGIISEQTSLSSASIDGDNDLTIVYDASEDSLKKTNVTALFTKALTGTSGKIYAPARATKAGLNIGTDTNPSSPESGDLYIKADKLSWVGEDGNQYSSISDVAQNLFTAKQTITVSADTPALDITQTGTGLALNINSNFKVSNAGHVGIGVEPDAIANISIGSGGIKYSDGTIQTSAMNTRGVANTLAVKQKTGSNPNVISVPAMNENTGYFKDNSTGFLIQWTKVTFAGQSSIEVEFQLEYPVKMVSVTASRARNDILISNNYATSFTEIGGAPTSKKKAKITNANGAYTGDVYVTAIGY
ncbi:MAG: hypothetical protein EB127_05345 [Alphaproteobacteria bacterium]|nr:hypothetical protein [Alphaproteobacteria bacterium]